VNKVWKLHPPSPSAPSLAAEIGVTPLQAQLLINRALRDPEEARAFLFPRLSSMHDPMLLKDMDRALSVILEALEKGDRIVIYGDYDADGVTATALLFHFFNAIHAPVSAYIPDRLEEGYGLNKEAVRKLASEGVGLIITVDCGISDREEIALAQDLGLGMVVTDHHRVPGDFTALCPVINPNRPDCPFPFKGLAGVGLAFFLAVTLRTELRERGWFRGRREPDLREYLDLVALGTVADRAPLRDQNRILVRSGIEVMGRTRWAGLDAMKRAAGIGDSDLTAEDLAFRLGPRLNAPGRMGRTESALRMLTVQDVGAARDLARELNALNERRQRTEEEILSRIEEVFRKGEGPEARKALVIGGRNWHKGVLGIVASRLVDKYHRPVLVLSLEDELAVGSGRSIAPFNLHEALTRLAHLLERFGGHALAAGLALKAQNLRALESGLEALADRVLSDEDLRPMLAADAEIPLDGIDAQLVRGLEALSPYGEGNPEPLFLARSLQVVMSRVVGERHLKLKVRQGRKVLDTIGFGMADRHPLQGRTLHMLFTPELNRWQGHVSVQLRIKDLVLEDLGGQIDVLGTEDEKGFLARR
jgi:single-stranded-DNA-specific exonuclease